MDLTIYFDGQYWSGLVEYRDAQEHLRVYRHVFGRKPSNQDIYTFIYETLPNILEKDWHSEIKSEKDERKRISPKRMQRIVQKQKNKPVLSTKAQQAMTEQREAMKLERKQSHKRRKLEEKQVIFEKNQQKRHEKKKGH